MAYTEPVLIGALKFSDMPGLTINTVEPTGIQWEEKIAPLLATDNKDPLQWIDIFIECLDSWDLQYADGRTVPLTRNGFMGHNIVFVEKVVRQWMNNAIVFPRQTTQTLTNVSESDPKPEPEPAPDPFAGLSVQALDATA